MARKKRMVIRLNEFESWGIRRVRNREEVSEMNALGMGVEGTAWPDALFAAHKVAPSTELANHCIELIQEFYYPPDEEDGEDREKVESRALRRVARDIRRLQERGRHKSPAQEKREYEEFLAAVLPK
jgi:hypothetical protein